MEEKFTQDSLRQFNKQLKNEVESKRSEVGIQQVARELSAKSEPCFQKFHFRSASSRKGSGSFKKGVVVGA